MEEEPVLCFQHCEKDVNIACLAMPAECPACGADLQTSPLYMPPFRLPWPFVKSCDSPFSVVVKPTRGNFLNDYCKDADLHLGVTDSKGTVFNYDQSGIQTSENGWNQCLAISMVFKPDAALTYTWDTKLHEFAMQPKWLPERYNESQHNCTDFVLGYLQHMALDKQHPCIRSRGSFSEEMVLPKTVDAAKYIDLYRHLLRETVMVNYGTSL